MNAYHPGPSTKTTRTWNTFAGYSQTGEPLFNSETQTVELTEFDEYFIHYLSDYLPTLTMNADGDGLDRIREFKELFVQVLLEAKHEYNGRYECP
jgi:hypothetical protein